jgi:hypothetical protein
VGLNLHGVLAQSLQNAEGTAMSVNRLVALIGHNLGVVKTVVIGFKRCMLRSED